MNPIAIAVLAIGMSVDALVASLGRGAALERPSFPIALRTGLVFGVVETLTPLLGWALGVAASRHVQAVDHWVAFVLLAGAGGHMARQALKRPAEAGHPAAAGWWPLVATAVGTSIDAMAVGVSLAFLRVDIMVIALAIGAATTVMSTAGVLGGRLLGHRFGRWAEFAGGLALIGLGLVILFQHLSEQPLPGVGA